MPLVTKTSKFSNVYKQDTEPIGWTNGDIWMDTLNDVTYKNVNGIAKLLGIEAAMIFG